tara:strand:- start:7552 stop:7683 length:132 start_codon:yes stop_codon:yes gene_type:complete
MTIEIVFDLREQRGLITFKFSTDDILAVSINIRIISIRYYNIQ